MGKGIIVEFFNMTAAALQFYCLTIFFIMGPVAVFWITFFTNYWYISTAYLVWIWIIDARTPERGGRICNWVQSSKFYAYVRDHYPVTLNAVPEFKLDPRRNYMFCYFPHGIMPNGGAIAFSSKACGVENLIPNHTVHPLTLNSHFKIPIMREYYLALGVCSVTADSINWLLNFPNGGKIIGVVVGGAAEAFHSNPGVYKIVLKNRKGFVKLALKNGSPLVPVFSFGEVDTFKQFQFSEHSLAGRLQEWCNTIIGVAPVLFTGRGYFQPYVGFIPRNKPINVVLGKVIDVQKNTNPSQEEIDNLHQTFMIQLNELFEEYKHKFIENPRETKLIIT